MRLARTLRPDAITLDVIMPGMDGWAVLGALKADPDLAEIPVAMVTIVDDRQAGYTLGATDYLSKPVDWARLSAVLAKHRATRPPAASSSSRTTRRPASWCGACWSAPGGPSTRPRTAGSRWSGWRRRPPGSSCST